MSAAAKSEYSRLYGSREWRVKHGPPRDLADDELREALERGFLPRALFEAELSRRAWEHAVDHAQEVSRRHHATA